MRVFLTSALCALPAGAQAAHASGGPRHEAWGSGGRPLDATTLRDTAVASIVRAEREFMDDVARRRLEGWVVHVAWFPVYAIVSESGDLGYTWGYYRWTSRDDKAAPAPPITGKYLTIWRRDDSGRWKVMVDTGNQGPVPRNFFDGVK